MINIEEEGIQKSSKNLSSLRNHDTLGSTKVQRWHEGKMFSPINKRKVTKLRYKQNLPQIREHRNPSLSSSPSRNFNVLSTTRLNNLNSINSWNNDESNLIGYTKHYVTGDSPRKNG
jgi:hypothetical protein